MMTKEHKHAAVLRAIADGVPISEFETICHLWKRNSWLCLSEYTQWVHEPEHWEIRRKPQHIIVNGFKVPKPLEKGCEVFTVFVPRLVGEFEIEAYGTDERINQAIELGLAHETGAAAIAHRRAMLGIDPEAA